MRPALIHMLHESQSHPKDRCRAIYQAACHIHGLARCGSCSCLWLQYVKERTTISLLSFIPPSSSGAPTFQGWIDCFFIF